MKVLQRVWNDIKQGENIDLYLTVFVAFIAVALNIIGFAPAKLIDSLTLAILGLIAISIIRNQHRLSELMANASQTKRSFFMEEWPTNFRRDLLASKEIWLLGVHLNRTIRVYYSDLEGKIKQGDKLKLLLVNPNCVASEMVANRSYARANVNRTRDQINVSLQFVHELHKIAPENVEIRTTEHPIAMGIVGIDPHLASGKLYMEYFAFKTNGLPYFVLSVKDRKWYNLFKEEMLLLWENATEWKWE